MITLGIESTAHTLGIGIVEDGNVLSNIHDIYRPKNEGIIPRKAADHHAECFGRVLKENLNKASVKMEEVDLISCAQGPGIGAPLSVGVFAARFLSLNYDKPLIGVNHGYSHAEVSRHLCNMKDPLVLYVSGGNTQILAKKGMFYEVLGETLDIGIGNLFDCFGREIGLEYAHGSVLFELAKKGSYVPMPYTVKGMNMSFSGLLSHAAREYASKKQKAEDLAYSIMETAFDEVCEATERALHLTRKKEFLVCGGVAQNKDLCAKLSLIGKDCGVRFGVAPAEYNRDNGAMIAYAGEILYKKYGTRETEYWKPNTMYRIDQMKEIFGKN